MHRRRKVLNIWGAKVQNTGMWGGGGGGGGGGRGSKLFAVRAPSPNQCQIITFLVPKTDDIEKLKIDLKSLLLEIHVSSNKIKGTYIKMVHL